MSTPTITSEHPGGNGSLVDRDGDVWYVEQELRDTMEDWFHWNIAANGMAGTHTIQFTGSEVVGPFGPAVSFDGIDWWFEETIEHDGRSFTYTFEDADPVYFAFAPQYLRTHLDRFLADDAVAAAVGVSSLTTTAMGRDVPLLSVGPPDGDAIVLTARHHACETTASYLLEAILRHAIDDPLTDQYRLLAVPFVDIDGVQRGDQGKSRAPHDHNRDYLDANEVTDGITPLYASTSGIIDLVRGLDRLVVGVDLHCPFKWGGRNDHLHFVKATDETPEVDEFGAALAAAAADAGEDCVHYDPDWDIGPTESWNKGFTPTCSWFMGKHAERFAASFEYPYFGTPDNRITPERTDAFGAAFVDALSATLD